MLFPCLTSEQILKLIVTGFAIIADGVDVEKWIKCDVNAPIEK